MSSENDLKNVRDQIDALDSKIVSAIQKRATLAKKIGEIKKESGAPIYRPDREKEVYEKISHLNQGPLPGKVLSAIYREIMSGSIAIEKGLKIGYLGPQGSFSHQAVHAKFGSSVESVDFSTIPEVFKAVESGRLDYGIVPVENSSEGIVNSTLDQFIVSDLLIYSEMYLRINIHLLGFERDFSKIQTVYGIKIANAQCRNWISANLPHAEIVETSATAKAAILVAEKRENCAAIASAVAAELYGLEIIEESIQDLANNTTRFLIIGNSQCEPTGRDKTSAVFGASDEPGSLWRILKPFAEKGINLTKIESRPTRRNQWEYNFFIDFLGHSKDPLIREVIQEAQKSTNFFRILGSYPVSSQIL